MCQEHRKPPIVNKIYEHHKASEQLSCSTHEIKTLFQISKRVDGIKLMFLKYNKQIFGIRKSKPTDALLK